MEFASEFNMKPTSQLKKCGARTTGSSIHDLDNQRQRIVRCTTRAMMTSPGGLRLKSGTRPWPPRAPAQPVNVIQAPCPTQTVRNAALCQLIFTPLQALCKGFLTTLPVGANWRGHCVIAP